MGSMIYLMIIILFLVLILWTCNNTKNFENKFQRVLYIVLGLAINSIIVAIIFNISKSGINYSNIEIMKEMRKFILLIFTPINGLLTMPIGANAIIGIRDGENKNKLLLILSIIFVIAIIFECSYFESIQRGVLQIIKLS